MSLPPMPSPRAHRPRWWLGERTTEALRLLDQGLLLYRRHLVRFLLPTIVLLLPLSVVTALQIALDNALLLLLTLLMWIVLPLLFLNALSQIALDLVQQQPINLWRSVWVNPLRVFVMLVYSIGFQFVVQIASSMFTLLCICPAFIAFAAMAGIGADFGSNLISTIATVAGGVLIVFGFVVAYTISIVISAMTISSLVYALQPFFQRGVGIGQALDQSFALLGYRLGYNLLVWALAAILFGALMLIVTLTVGVLVPIPLALVLGEESPIAQSLSGFAVLCGLILALPPLPIWMALLSHQHQQARTASDLAQRIGAWQGSTTAPDLPVAPPAQG